MVVWPEFLHALLPVSMAQWSSSTGLWTTSQHRWSSLDTTETAEDLQYQRQHVQQKSNKIYRNKEYARHTENIGHSGRNRSLLLIISLQSDHQRKYLQLYSSTLGQFWYYHSKLQWLYYILLYKSVGLLRSKFFTIYKRLVTFIKNKSTKVVVVRFFARYK